MPTPAPIKLNSERLTRIAAQVRFLTYVFGGGVTHNTDAQGPSKPFDPITPIRSASCRGQLRFWWRATTGARLKSMDELRKREAELWGAIWDGPVHGAASITVDFPKMEPQPRPVFSWRQGKNFAELTRDFDGTGIEYGAFPMRPPNNPNQEGPDLRSSLWDYGEQSFKVYLDVPIKFKAEVELAMSAWLTFGGYGGRLTRGFGAIALTEQAHDELVDDPERFFQKLNASYPQGSKLLANVPAISADPVRCVTLQRGNAYKAWSYGLKTFQQFRQGPNQGRNPGAQHNRPGRSRWPEPDEIRRITRTHDRIHAPTHEARAFPRADFGLPIIFHFQSKSDPRDTTLQVNRDQDRFPSPLILRPSSKGECVALWLEGAQVPERLSLSGTEVRKSVTSSELAKVQDNQRVLLEPNPIQAFLDYLSKNN